MTDEIAEETQKPDSKIALGALLQKNRENVGLSIEQVAEKLRVLPSAVKGIETADYSRMRGEVFTRGYIKAYATFLGLDPQQCLTMYGESPSDDTGLKPIEPPKLGKSDGLDLIVKLALPLIIITVLWISYKVLYRSGDVAAIDVGTTEIQLEEFAVDPSGSVNLADLSLQQSLEQLIASNDLVVEFTDSSTISVGDEQGQLLVDDQLKRKGDVIHVTGSQVYSLLIGYGEHVNVYFEGEQVELAYSKDNPVVKIDLGSEQ